MGVYRLQWLSWCNRLSREGQGILNLEKRYLSLMKSIKPMLRSRESQIVLEFAFWNATIPYDKNMIYELRTYLLKPGRLLEWEQGW
jgi:hypothetical protein